jgi:hypothetical protein
VIESSITTSTPEFLVLHATRIRGLASEVVLIDLTALPQETVAEECAHAVEEGLLSLRDGRAPGYRLTEIGRLRHADLLRSDVLGPDRDSALLRLYQDFLTLNEQLKELTSAWQMKDENTPNDHADEQYDATVIARLAALHGHASASLSVAAAGLARLSTYASRLTVALERVRGGDLGAFARPMAGSYHDAWMELHQDLLLSLGKERSAADGH